jgi:hypothetical protein
MKAPRPPSANIAELFKRKRTSQYLSFREDDRHATLMTSRHVRSREIPRMLRNPGKPPAFMPP